MSIGLMKCKIALILICLLLMVGCKENEIIPSDEPNDSQNEIPSYTKEDLKSLDKLNYDLYTYAVEIYDNKKYEKYDKSKGVYIITLKQIRDDLGYDISRFISPLSNEKCDIEKTQILIDVDNIYDIEYKEYPVLVELHCS